MSTADEPVFTVKELLTKLGGTLDEMDHKLDQVVAALAFKADRAEVEALRLLVENIRLIQAESSPIDTRAAVERHLREPHSVAQRHEQRIAALERWKYALPPALFFSIAALALALVKAL